MLLANEKTRLVGIVLLASALLLAGLAIAGLLLWVGICRYTAAAPSVHELSAIEWDLPAIHAILTPEAAASLGGR